MERPIQNTYICIQSWMLTELDLKGNDLMIYAIIYGFCQDGESRYKGGRSYLAKWTNSTVRGVQKNLNRLVEQGVLAKEEKRINGVKACDYYPVNLPWEKKDAPGRTEGSGFDEGQESQTGCPSDDEGNNVPSGGEQSSLGVGNKVPLGGEQSSLGVGNKVPLGREQSSPHNIKSNILDNIKSTSSSETGTESTKRKSSDVDRVVEAWNTLQSYGIKAVSRLDPSSERYKMLQARMKQYGSDSVFSAIENIKKSGFLQGHGRKGWSITFDWFVRPNNFPKVLEGNYEDRGEVNEHGRGDGGDGTEIEDMWVEYAKKQLEQRKNGGHTGSGLPNLQE